ncbi:MAG: hypothetical protein VW450_06005 [Chloroflexota bacterium]
MESEKKTTAMGVSENVVGLLAYLLTWITGFVFLNVEKENKTVRFHAGHSIAVFVPLTVAGIITAYIPGAGALLSWLVSIIALIAWIGLMAIAVQGKRY